MQQTSPDVVRNLRLLASEDGEDHGLLQIEIMFLLVMIERLCGSLILSFVVFSGILLRHACRLRW